MAGTDLERFVCASGCEGSEWDVWGDWRTAEEIVELGFHVHVHGAPQDPVADRVFVPEGGIESFQCPSCLALGRWKPTSEEDT